MQFAKSVSSKRPATFSAPCFCRDPKPPHVGTCITSSPSHVKATRWLRSAGSKRQSWTGSSHWTFFVSWRAHWPPVISRLIEQWPPRDRVAEVLEYLYLQSWFLWGADVSPFLDITTYNHVISKTSCSLGHYLRAIWSLCLGCIKRICKSNFWNHKVKIVGHDNFDGSSLRRAIHVRGTLQQHRWVFYISFRLGWMAHDLCFWNGLPSKHGNNNHGRNEYDDHLHFFQLISLRFVSGRGAVYGEIPRGRL